MRALHRLSPLVFLIGLFSTAAFAQTHTANITVSSLQVAGIGGAAAPMPYGTVCAYAVGTQGSAVSVTESGWGLVPAGTNICGGVVTGAISGGINVPDANHSYSAAPFNYNFVIQQTDASGNAIGLPIAINNVPNVTGSSWALDAYTPTVSAPAISPTVGYGSTVPTSCTSPSIWVTTGGTAYGCAGGVYNSLATAGPIGPAGGVLAGVIEAGVSPYTSIQSAVDAATAASESVLIPESYAGTDTYTNPGGATVVDQRAETQELARMTAFMAPWLNKLGAGSGGNLTQLATCIQAGSCTVEFIGNSIVVGGQNSYENSVAVELEEALEARYGHIFTWQNLGLPARSVQNYAPDFYQQLPICPTNTPACATAAATAPYASFTYSGAYGWYYPPSSNMNAEYGPPFNGADRMPWPNYSAAWPTNWMDYSVSLNPDAVFFLFGMNDQGITGSAFTADMQTSIAPFLALTKVPSIILIDGPNGSISATGLAYFSQQDYARLDEFGEDSRYLAQQKHYGLIDVARILSAVRDSSDTATSWYQTDSSSFLNLSTNWVFNGDNGGGTVTGTGTGSSVVQNTISSQDSAGWLRLVLARDSVMAATWTTSNAAVVTKIYWRAPSASVSGYLAQVTQTGGGTATVQVYYQSTLLATAGVSGITSLTSFMVKAEGANYYVWVNGKLVIGPDYPTAGFGWDYHSITYGYSGFGAATTTVGTTYTTTISYATLKFGNPPNGCATPLNNRQSAPPCAPAYASDQSLYGDPSYPTVGGNSINHPTIPGTFATYGVAMVPFLDQTDRSVVLQEAGAYTRSQGYAKVGASNVWTVAQTLPMGSQVGAPNVNSPNIATYATPPGTGALGNDGPCTVYRQWTGTGNLNWPTMTCVAWGSNPNYTEYRVYTSPSANAGSEVWSIYERQGAGATIFEHGVNAANFTAAVYTVSALPSASSLSAGTQVVVSDATTFTPGTCTGGGSDTMIAVTNGSAWSCH